MLRKNFQNELKKLNISLVYLFGSSVTGTQRENSDIDIGVVFEKPDYLQNSLRIYEELYALFSRVFPKREVDIVFLERASLPFQFEVITTGKILYSISEKFAFHYKEKIIKEYVDFKPLLDIQDRALLERL
ncbi:MAG: nucleotidyltransferase domain-containing protein [Candidatus Atribacteria bacterium]|nr:nucleotidyltransferase domain-containing protein [Candidatus Atribacteria bacterium]